VIKASLNQVYALPGDQDEGKITKTAKGTYRIKKARARTRYPETRLGGRPRTA
jgi:hypothetical protein